MKQFQLERDIERHLTLTVEAVGGLCYKWESNVNGVPDRICILPNGQTLFVEVKNGTRGRLSPIQQYRIKELQKRKALVFVVSTKEEAENLVKRFYSA